MDAIDLSKQEIPRIKVILPDGKTEEEIRLPGIAVAIFLQRLPKVYGVRGLKEIRDAEGEPNPEELVNAVNAVLGKVKPDFAGLLDFKTCAELFGVLMGVVNGSREVDPAEKKSCNSPQSSAVS